MYRYNSLEDFLATNQLSADGQADDGGGALFPVKGREINATILFSDITSFSKRTLNLSPTETLIFVNNFFSWISAEALRGRAGIIDKYIGDEIMVVFSDEFGSADPFVEAVQTARWMAENDHLDFCPHIGIASGRVTVGYVGTPIKYDCSVFGAAVAMAKRCSSVEPESPDDVSVSRFVFPASEWANRSFDEIFPSGNWKGPTGETIPRLLPWELRPIRKVEMRNIGDVEVREVYKLTRNYPFGFTAESRAQEILKAIQEQGRYWPQANPHG